MMKVPLRQFIEGDIQKSPASPSCLIEISKILALDSPRLLRMRASKIPENGAQATAGFKPAVACAHN